jgi:hypothetical protein
MTLPASGAISLAQVATELGISASGINLNQANVRALAGGATNMNALRGKSASTPLSAIGHDDTAYYQNTGSGSGTIRCYPMVVASGGSGGYTYAWTKQSGSGNISNSTIYNPNVYMTYSKSSSGNAVSLWSCVVTDSLGHQVTVTDIMADLNWGILM